MLLNLLIVNYEKSSEIKKVFPNDMAVFKIFYLAIENITKKWTLPIQNWNTAIAHFMIKFEDRINLN
ncbi:hypothetical protein SHM_23790 [Spiroplasma ixodetis]|uniref:Transposase n=1 Tax=Spiroplasma ixodetis TaxID=2141 RepID=A0ABN6T2E2_9MOLU|nr:hypothetical protein SHM_14160 [Spiroplasma ixodetis]BDT03786.1 hypothetical protein SHM_14320 [Spiroplasma ixodetis]BDT04733.1 hypothetical protein SHM_23790 [Spiroplasma ixodetis]